MRCGVTFIKKKEKKRSNNRGVNTEMQAKDNIGYQSNRRKMILAIWKPEMSHSSPESKESSY